MSNSGNFSSRGGHDTSSNLPTDLEQDCHPVAETQGPHDNLLTSRQSHIIDNYSQMHPLVTGGSSINRSHVSLYRKNNNDIVPEISNIYDGYKSEEKRLETFYDWPLTIPVTKEDLARNGFIYMHVNDRTQCIFCRGVLSSWERGDVVGDEHKRHCPECPFAFGYECGNLPLRQTSTIILQRHSATSSPQPQLHPSASNSERQSFNTTVKLPVQSQFSQSRGETTALNRADSRPFGLSSLGPTSSLPALPTLHTEVQQTRANDVTTNEPKYRDWGDEYKRLRSFKGWPTQMSQTPLDLAKAGLLYMGNGDRCKCFWCGGELYDWEPQDIPWEEHAKWFSHCGYVRAIKGDAFIQHVRNVQNGTVQPLHEHMRTPHVLSVLAEGYTPEQVEEVFSRFGRERLVDARGIKQAIEQTKSDRQAMRAGSGSAGTQETTSTVTLPDEDVEMEELGPDENSQEEIAEKEAQNKSKGSESVTSSSSSTVSRPGSTSPSDKDVETVLKENEKLKDQKLCKICMDNELCMTFMPCGHLAMCEHCANSVKECPICRKPITQKLKVFWS